MGITLNNLNKSIYINVFKILFFYFSLNYIFNNIFLENLIFQINGYFNETLITTIQQYLFLLIPTLYYINQKLEIEGSIINISDKFNNTLNFNFDYKLIIISLSIILIIQYSNTLYIDMINDAFYSFEKENWITNLINEYYYNNNEMIKKTKSMNLLFIVLGFAIIPAIIEETLFRGYFLLKITEHKNQNFTLIFSSLFFALLHFNPIFIVQYFILGLILGHNYNKTQNLMQPIILHFLNNLIVIINLKYFTI